MARGDDPDVPVPEADRLEQQEPADPVGADAEPWPDSPPTSSADVPPGGSGMPPGGDVDDAADKADEADRLEQAQDVDGDPDEEYARDQE